MAQSSKCKTDGAKPAVFKRLALMAGVGPSRDNADLSYVGGNGNDNISLKCGVKTMTSSRAHTPQTMFELER